MAYNPGGQPPYNPQYPYNQPPPPPPPPSGGMGTGAKVALFGCLGLIVLGIVAVVAIGIIGYTFGNKNTNTASTSNSNSSSSSNSNSKSTGSNSNSKTTPTTKKSGVTVDSLELARDDNGKAGDRVTVFHPKDNPMHFVVELSEFESGTKVKVVLMAVSVATGEKNVKVGEIERETGTLENQMDATMTLPRDWPTGTYRVDVFVDGTLDKSQEFEVEE